MTTLDPSLDRISIASALRFGWWSVKRRPGFFVMLMLAGVGFSGAENRLDKGIEAIAAQRPDFADGVRIAGWLVALGLLFLETLLRMNVVRIALRVVDRQEPNLSELVETDGPVWRYLGAKMLVALAIVLGLVLFVVPGLVAAAQLSFFGFVIVDRQVGVIDSIRTSARLTRGVRWDVARLGLALLGLNILGMLAFLVGVFVTSAISMVALAHVYRQLCVRERARSDVSGPVPEQADIVVETAFGPVGLGPGRPPRDPA